MNAYGYTRVSSKGQVDGDGEARQLDKIRDFCASQALTFMGHRFEAGISGATEAVDRPAFLALLATVQPGEAIVVERLDRLARDLMVQEILLRECRERGILVFATDQFSLQDMASDAGDPTRKLIRQVLGALAEWEKSALVLKLRAARDRKRAATGRCEGVMPYGSFPGERQILEAMDAVQGQSYNQVADFLNAAGLKTRMGREWTWDSVRGIIRRRKARKETVCKAD